MKTCELPGCNRRARRRFCCNAHKDKYHNLHSPRGKFAHLADENRHRDLEREVDDDMHPFDTDALGQG